MPFSHSPFDSLWALFENPDAVDFDNELCRRLCDALDCDHASILQLDPDGSTLSFRCAPNLDPALRDSFCFNLGEGICGAAALTGSTIIVFDASLRPEHRADVDRRTGLVTRSLLAAPAIHAGRCLAVIELMNRRAAPFGENDKALARAAAALYAARMAGIDHRHAPSAPPALPVPPPPLIVGASLAMQHVLERVLKAGPSDLPVLITGETGTGKELVARRLHACSARRHRPLVTINCAALSETLLESELFGHRKGAFTGADRDRVGRLEEADGGTLFLDEIGDMSRTCQAKLLRALDYGEISPVGSNETRRIDVRVISATNRPLESMIAGSDFRADLYYRLGGMVIDLPPLRRRPEDIPLLADFFLRSISTPAGHQPQLSAEALELLMNFAWAGNVRQLRWAVQSAAMLAGSRVILPADLPEAVRSAVPAAPESSSSLLESLPPPIEDRERERLLAALRETAYPGTRRWNLSRAARQLGMARKTFEYQVRRVYRLRRTEIETGPGSDLPPLAERS